MGSALKSVQATIRGTGYTSAPVSLLMIDGKPPDLIFPEISRHLCQAPSHPYLEAS